MLLDRQRDEEVARTIADEFSDLYSPSELIPGLTLSIVMLAKLFPEPGRALDESVRLMEEYYDQEEG